MHCGVEDGSRKQIVSRLKAHAPLPEIQAHALTKFAYKHIRFYVREYGTTGTLNTHKLSSSIALSCTATVNLQQSDAANYAKACKGSACSVIVQKADWETAPA